jgi:hypothetical protein
MLKETLLSSPIFGTRKCFKSGAVQLGLPRCCWLQKTQAQNTHAIAHLLDTVRCSLCSSARPQCRWMQSFRQRWHARIGKLHVCKHLSLKSKSRKGCQNVLCEYAIAILSWLVRQMLLPVVQDMLLRSCPTFGPTPRFWLHYFGICFLLPV